MAGEIITENKIIRAWMMAMASGGGDMENGTAKLVE
jgi:hypothetical protein